MNRFWKMLIFIECFTALCLFFTEVKKKNNKKRYLKIFQFFNGFFPVSSLMLKTRTRFVIQKLITNRKHK